jgi:hypothetical protein
VTRWDWGLAVVCWASLLALGTWAVADDLDLPISLPLERKAPVVETDPEDDLPVIFYGEEVAHGDSIVFVIDRSCSMAYAGRMASAVRETSKAVADLHERLLFDVVSFDNRIDPFNGSLVRATEENKAAAVAWIGELFARGGTNTGAATVYALSMEPDVVVLLSDGAPARSPASERELIRSHNRGSVIDTFGIHANVPVMRGFLVGVAGDNQGSYTDVP